MTFKSAFKKTFLTPHQSNGIILRHTTSVEAAEERREVIRQARHEAHVHARQEQIRREADQQHGVPEELAYLEKEKSWDYFRDTEEGRKQIEDAMARAQKGGSLEGSLESVKSRSTSEERSE